MSDVIDLDGVAVTLVDSAGIRVTNDAVEAEGVARARQALAVASSVVVVLDRSAGLEEEDGSVLEATAGTSRVVALNKIDVASPSAWPREALDLPPETSVVEVSARTGQGLDMLRSAVRAGLIGEETYRDTPTVGNQRHIGLLERASGALVDAQRAAQDGATEEFVLADLQRARTAFEELTGARTPDDVVNHIFERFCIGK